MKRIVQTALTLASLSVAAAAQGQTTPANSFWTHLSALCDRAFVGRVVESVPPDTVMSRTRLVMHVRSCSPDTIRIPFHVGANRSRTWVITRTATGLRLKHDHRHEDGSEDAVTQYGGDTRVAGTDGRQDFHADSLTAVVAPAARTNIWTIEVLTGATFAYALRREGSDRRFRVEFDLTQPVPPPPAPWGARATQQSSVSMRHIQPELFAATGSLVNALADVDNDGDVDIFVGFNGAPNRLYRNGGGMFAEVGAEVGLADARATRAAAFGDWDADGDSDLLVGFAPGAGPVLKLYRNDRGKFTDATAAAELRVDSGAVRQPVWVDYDADGDLDLFVAFRDRPNALYRNTAGKLADVAAEIGLADTRRTVGAVWADLDQDGDLDVVVGNMDGDANGVFRNDAGRFTDVAVEWDLAAGGRALGERTSGTVRPCVADMNGDGRLDIITANYGPAGLFLKTDAGFADVSASSGIGVDGRYDACAPADVDNDGRLDLYINGTVTQGRNWPDYLYRGVGERFESAIPEILNAIPADHGVQWADLNGDGAIDIALTGQGPHAVLASVLPDSVARRSLSIRVLDARGRAMRAGAEIRVYAAGTRRVLATRLVDAGSGYDAQSDVPVHIGLPTTARVDVEITWPAAGRRSLTRRSNVGVDGRRTLEVRVP
jgi:hypothetical protein